MVPMFKCGLERSNVSFAIVVCFVLFLLFEPMRGIEPLTFSLPRKRSTPELHRLIPTKDNLCFDASGRRGSNSRPTAWKAVALPTELLPHFSIKVLWGQVDSNHWTRRSGFTVRRNCRYAIPPKLPRSPEDFGALLYLEPPVGIEPTTY